MAHHLRYRLSGATLVAFALVGSAELILRAQDAPAQSPTPIPSRTAEMRDHFSQVTKLHEALIRGDLRALLAPAAELATTDPPERFAEISAPFVEEIRRAARRAGTAPNLRSAAASMVTLLGQCAACHQAAGVYPSPASPRRPDLPMVVGHMLEHQRAADDMLQGLMMPSASRWLEAADKLEAATLRPDEWPSDSKLTAEARQADTAVHALADRARTATTARARANLYVDLVTTCASCHSLHPSAWGPRSVR
jgi:cytochrome c556